VSERERIRAVALDVDGVLTDGALYWGAGGEELKRISFRDVMGISLGRRAGLRFALISGEGGPLLERLGRKLQISDVYAHCKDKAGAVRSFASTAGLEPGQICYMGDDVNDVPAMELVGLSAAPASAHSAALAVAGVVTRNAGGNGAVRELVDYLIGDGSR
jgi:3-deoxy-D-manno-octulosonate 8-phosphate phosphatase (KDO 8-P phosphatase)